MYSLEVASLEIIPYILFRYIITFLERNDFVSLAGTSRYRAFFSLILLGELKTDRFSFSKAKCSSLKESLLPVATFRFLNINQKEGLNVNCGSCILASYPRCGNSLLRRLLENGTGVITGSDTRPDKTLSQSLTAFGYQGEGIVDFKRVLVVKTHWPERRGWISFRAKRVILIVRNPFDAIDSYFNLAFTNTHNKSLQNDVYAQLWDVWDDMVKNEIEIWNKFNIFWLSTKLPLLVVRYEDLLSHTAEVMSRVLSFVHGCESLTEMMTPKWSDVGPKSCKNHLTYKPRQGGQIGKSFVHYSNQQMQHIVEVAGNTMRGFGYDTFSQGFPNNSLYNKLPMLSRCTKNIRVDSINGTSNNDKSVVINTAYELRKEDDLYGRNVSELRRNITDNDKIPLLTVYQLISCVACEAFCLLCAR